MYLTTEFHVLHVTMKLVSVTEILFVRLAYSRGAHIFQKLEASSKLLAPRG